MDTAKTHRTDGTDGEQGRVELRSRATPEEIRAALDATRRLRTSPWVFRLFVLVVAVLIAFRAVGTGDGVNVPVLVVGAVYLLYGLLFLPKLLRGPFNAAVKRTVIDGDGIVRTLEKGDRKVTLPWAKAPRWHETPHAFVLLSGGRLTACLMVLPKRTLRTADGTDRLRALLTAHSRQV
ncbi:YcxB family protein [Streptomyces sp. NPDC049881]|uniref:YcxB family protein n=1 Tax=Streptomyces sp. NPDC049881 TaxID=3155778 RepID=UPI003441C42F